MYLVTRRFIGGLLEGLSYTEKTSVEFKVGFVCLNPVGGSPYVIVSIKESVC